jgi:dihydroceramidase
MTSKACEFWGEPTATIDWCENNYEVTEYIAEFWNTLSNLVMIVLPVYGIYWSVRQKQNKKNLNNFIIRNSTLAVYFALMMIGSGSWLFHMTLLYPMQLLDELPMIYGFGCGLFALFDILESAYQLENEAKNEKNKTNLPSRLTVFALIVFYCLMVTFIYIFVWPDPIFHQIAFGIMVAAVILLGYKTLLMYKLSKKLYILALTYLILAFGFWNLDNNFCSHLQNYRHGVERLFGVNKVSVNEKDIRAVLLNAIAVTLKIFSEFHSLWHVFTGISAYLAILCLTELNYEHHLKSCKIKNNKKRPVNPTCFNMFYDFTRVENETNKKVKTKALE